MTYIVQVEALAKQVPNPSLNDKNDCLTILQQVSFQIKTGESVAIVGASGSGKSTLLGLLAGLDTPSNGRVLLDGHDLNTLNEDKRAALRGRLAGFVFQTFQLLPSLTALENVALPLALQKDPHAREQAKLALDKVGLAARTLHLPKHLSGGEQQRVALARAIVTQPKILFADEPTGNLDAHTGQQIIELILALNAELNTTLILVTHDKTLAQRCTRQIKLAAGQVIG